MFISFFRIGFWASCSFALFMALIPAPILIEGNSGDKLLHIATFFILTIFAGIAYPMLSVFRISIYLAIFGALIEILQSIPVLHRDGDFFDWLSDVLAVFIGSIFLNIFRTIIRNAHWGKH